MMGEQAEIRKCGSSWACCDGDCVNCSAMTMTYSDRTEVENA